VLFKDSFNTSSIDRVDQKLPIIAQNLSRIGCWGGSELVRNSDSLCGAKQKLKL
jgi:hypothetical protein